MTVQVTFLPFINGSKEDEDGRGWRKNQEKAFLERSDIIRLTDEIEQIRKGMPKRLDENKKEIAVDKERLGRYYNDLHQKNSERQRLWLDYLSGQTVRLFEEKLSSIPQADPGNGIVVAALPEFFWYDIFDRDKHLDYKSMTDEERNGEQEEGAEAGDVPKKVKEPANRYHKPIYDVNMINVMCSDNNPLASLTGRYPNLIFFGGTVMWKVLDPEGGNDEKINNTLIIYHSGKFAQSWSKCIFSSIDGFSSEKKKNKRGEFAVLDKDFNLISKPGNDPYVEFHGVKFAYDICLDFSIGADCQPLSKELLGNKKTDLNVLIAHGKKFKREYGIRINSDVILRCDGGLPPYGQIAGKAEKNQYDESMIVTPEKAQPGQEINSIERGTTVGVLKTQINIS